MRYRAPTGTHDILPEEQPYWRFVIEKAQQLGQLYGYEPIDVPVFEATSLFERGVGETTDIVEKEMYTFPDRSGESMTLRPEFTAGIVRAYVEHGMQSRPQPVRLYTIGPAFRYERPQAGRFRQFHQFNVEAIGSQDPAVDLEVMLIAWQLYEDVGIRGLSFQINSTGCPICRPGYVAKLTQYYEERAGVICEDCTRRLERNPLRLLDCKNEPCQPVIEEAPRILDSLCEECRTHCATLRTYLDVLNRPYRLNHRLVRGLDYYTKTVFEVWVQGIGAQGAVCGGGRYDGLVEMTGGPPTPAVGFASGIDRIILAMKSEGITPPAMPTPRVGVAYLGAAAKTEAVLLLQDLRGRGIGTTALWGDRSLKAQMKHADRIGVEFVLILGEQELQTATVVVRRMADSTQVTVPRTEVLDALSGHRPEQ